MAACLTVWTSGSTRLAESQVGNIVHSAHGLEANYDNISLAGCNKEEIIQKINDAFHKLVSLTMTDSTMHVVAVVPLYEETAAERIKSLYDACVEAEHQISLHVLGLCGEIANLFGANENENQADSQEKAVEMLVSIAREAALGFSHSLIDEFASNGAPIGFNIQSLSRFIAMIQIALMRDYYAIFSPSLLSSHPDHNLSLGLSSLSFDKKAVINQLLGLGFLAALDQAGINREEVDIQKATHEAETILNGISARYQKLYEKSIRPLFKDGMEESEVVALATPIIEEDLDQLKHDLLKLKEDKNLTFPEKEAVLALILGRDNESLRGIQYDQDTMLIDDACDESINLYITAYNGFCDDKSLLPGRQDFTLLKYPEPEDEEQKKEIQRLNSLAFNPLPDIKRLKHDIINITSYIRDKNSDLQMLKESETTREKAQDIRRQWKKPQGNLADVDYKEKPLQEKYSPHPSVKIKETVDLRKFFPPVRNQYKLGACTSFAVASMYEAMMNRSGILDSNVMSPAFLYYYSNVMKGRPAGGSNYFEQLEVLEKNGICFERLYEYDQQDPTLSPSEDAVADAQSHKVLKAKQISIANGNDKKSVLQENHRMFASALSEGFPIGISLKIYDNLGKEGAFVSHPKDNPDAKEEGWHAMVLVGYSDEKDLYIVRNSWGPEIGDNGYLYIPSAYVEDPDYINFACVITQISDSADDAVEEIPTVLADFAATETEIKMAAIRNAISKMRVELESCQKLYSAYYQYYQRLMQCLAMPMVQKKIRQAAERAQSESCMDLEAKKGELENSFVRKLKDYKKELTKGIVIAFVIALGFGIGWYFSNSYWVGIVTLCFAGLGVLLWLGYKWWTRIKRRSLQNELDEIAVNLRRQQQNLLEMQIKYHVAGIWISRFHRLSLELDTVYDRLKSFNGALREWQKSYSAAIRNLEAPEGQMFRVLDATARLESFFNSNKEKIVDKIDLLKVFEEYQIDVESLEKSHEDLSDSVRSAIGGMMEDFNIINYLLGDSFPYLAESNIEKELSSLLAVGQPTFRNRNREATAPVRILLADVQRHRASEWEQKAFHYFPMRPIQIRHNDSDSIIILTIHPINPTNN